MTHVSKLTFYGSALLVGAGLLGLTTSAQASATYPPKLQLALEAQVGKPLCVPQCLACHQTNLGGIGTLNVFGQNLKTYGKLMIREPDNVGAKVKAYFDAVKAAEGTGKMPNGDSDGDGMSDEMEIANGDSPSVAFPGGVSLFCPDIKYGCAGGRIAAVRPPRDGIGLLGGALTALGLTATRRWRRARRNQSR